MHQTNHTTQESSAASISKKAKGISIRLLVVAGVLAAALFVFGLIADEMVLEQENALDHVAFQALTSITHPAVTHLMVYITFFGSSYFLFPAYTVLVVYFLFFKKNYTLSLDVAAVGITSWLILIFLKDLFQRHRPPNPLIQNVNGFSFPSGHAFSSFTFFGLLIYILWNYHINPVLRWTLSIFFFLFACAVAFSRVYLHVHYASDVVAGFCLCIIWLTISFWLLKKLRKNRSFAA